MSIPIYLISTIVDEKQLTMVDIAKAVFTSKMNVKVTKKSGLIKMVFNNVYILRIADQELYNVLDGKPSGMIKGGKKTRKKEGKSKKIMKGGRAFKIALLALFYFIMSNLVTYNIANDRGTQNPKLPLNLNTATSNEEIQTILSNVEEIRLSDSNGNALPGEFIQALQDIKSRSGERQLVSSSSEFQPDETTLFAEVKLPNSGPTQALMNVTKNLKLHERPFLIYPGSGHDGARGISMYGSYRREGNNITVTGLFDVQGEKRDARFPTATHDSRLAELYKKAAVEQISTMYQLNMLDTSKSSDTGYFNFLAVETPVIPTGYNPFAGRSDMFHQDGVGFIEPIDGETNKELLLKRRVKHYQCNMCGKRMNPYNVHLTMTYEQDVMTANFQNKRDHPQLEGEEEITEINTSSELSQQQTFFMNQPEGTGHSAVATGTHKNRMISLFFVTENGEEWKPPTNTTLVPIFEDID
uniref:Uncharacterized protein n=1 Tax=viral metagenome TaxID=1070528 RepID=A0A6C0CNQ3_9ZZZZ